jgi:signal transduction histidine kinase
MAVDAVVAAAALAALLTFTAIGHRHHPHLAHSLALYLLAPVASLPLAVRRRWPLPVFALVLAASVAFGVLGSAISTVTAATYALYTVAVTEDRRRSLLALAAIEAGVAVNFALITKNTSNPVNWAFTTFVQFTVWVVGDGVRRHRAYVASLQQQSLQHALAEQRLEIARELHDVVAHAMTVVAIQAGVGGHLIASRPDEAAKSLGAIEATARAALAETRYLLNAMRDGGHDPASLTPMPGLGTVSGIVKQVAEAGQPVSLRVEGQPRALSPSLELSAYRVVQEALTNIVRHAGRPAARPGGDLLRRCGRAGAGHRRRIRFEGNAEGPRYRTRADRDARAGVAARRRTPGRATPRRRLRGRRPPADQGGRPIYLT